MSRNKRSEFYRQLNGALRPKLESLGFKEISFKDCMQPEFLFNKDRLWFGASFDWRDQYLEVGMGRLYWFKAVMKRVIVLGDYNSYCSGVTSAFNAEEGAARALGIAIRDTFDNAIKVYHERYDEILAERTNPKKYAKEFFTHLNREVTPEDVVRFARDITNRRS